MAPATALSRETLRFHAKRGLLRARRGANGYRDYPPEAADWLRYLRAANWCCVWGRRRRVRYGERPMQRNYTWRKKTACAWQQAV